MFTPWHKGQLEITDVIVDYDPHTLARQPVQKSKALARLKAHRSSTAASRIVEDIATSQDDVLDSQIVDELVVTVHVEMQRLWKEFLHGERVATLLRPIIDVLRSEKRQRPIRIVDVGCGGGYAVSTGTTSCHYCCHCLSFSYFD